jgi:hypothetical protein
VTAAGAVTELDAETIAELDALEPRCDWHGVVYRAADGAYTARPEQCANTATHALRYVLPCRRHRGVELLCREHLARLVSGELPLHCPGCNVTGHAPYLEWDPIR